MSQGLSHETFLYVNVAGPDLAAKVGEFHQPMIHLVPLMLDAIAGKRPALTIDSLDYEVFAKNTRPHFETSGRRCSTDLVLGDTSNLEQVPGLGDDHSVRLSKGHEPTVCVLCQSIGFRGQFVVQLFQDHSRP